MTLTNYWWLLIWLFVAGGVLTATMPKQPVQILGKTEYRWGWLPAIILTCPYAIWAMNRSNFGDSLLSSKLQKNMSEKWLLFNKATFSDCIEGSFL